MLTRRACIMNKSRKILFAVTGVASLALLAIGCFYLAFSPRTFQGPDDMFSLRYPRSWQAEATGGVATFTERDGPPGETVSVTVVIAKAAAGWAGDFEQALSDAFGAIGSDYRFLGKETVRLPGGAANKYAYSVVLEGNRRDNVVYVFPVVPEKAAVMTCSASSDRLAALEATCRDFAASFRLPAP